MQLYRNQRLIAFALNKCVAVESMVRQPVTIEGKIFSSARHTLTKFQNVQATIFASNYIVAFNICHHSPKNWLINFWFLI